jgi:serine/threonine-protein kinase
MGAVYAARHEALGRVVAVEVLHAEMLLTGAAVERFHQEARVAVKVRHPHIVEVLDFGSEGSQLYLVLELLQGESLEALRRREGKLSPARALALLDPILGALAYMHGLGVVHRDLKPDNIFVAVVPGVPEPVPKLLDFGIARDPSQSVRLTASGVMMGTPLYMAPEQTWGPRDLDARADQWSIAAVLYELVTGRPPYEGETLPMLIHRRMSGPPPDPQELEPTLSPALSAVLLKALAAERDARYPTIDAFREALAPFGPARARSAWDAPTGEELAHPGALGGGPSPGAITPADQSPPPRPAAEPEATPVVPPEPMAPVPVAPRPPTPGLRLGVWALGLLGSLVVLAAISLQRVLAAPDRSPPPTPTAPTATTVEPVTLRFDFDPPEAVMTLNGERLGAGHASVRRPRDGRSYELRVEAPGHEPFREVVVASGDVTLARSLRPIPAPVPGPTPGRPPRAPPPQGPRGASAPAGRGVRSIYQQWPPGG